MFNNPSDQEAQQGGLPGEGEGVPDGRRGGGVGDLGGGADFGRGAEGVEQRCGKGGTLYQS